MAIQIDKRFVSEEVEANLLLNPQGYKEAFVKCLKGVEPDFRIDDDNADILASLYEWSLGITAGGEVTEDKRLSPTLGLLFLGKPGTGKTTMMRGLLRFVSAVRTQHRWHEVVQTDDGVKTGWRAMDEKFECEHRRADDICTQYSYEGRMGVEEFKSMRHLFIDELGTETIPSGYKSETHNVLKSIILGRYDNWQRTKDRYATFITTHLSIREIDAVYGRSALDKLAQMCNLVEFKGESRRPYAFDPGKYLDKKDSGCLSNRPQLTLD